jgi:hypothetical protein
MMMYGCTWLEMECMYDSDLYIYMYNHVNTCKYCRTMHNHHFILGIKQRICEFWVCPTGEQMWGGVPNLGLCVKGEIGTPQA